VIEKSLEVVVLKCCGCYKLCACLRTVVPSDGAERLSPRAGPDPTKAKPLDTQPARALVSPHKHACLKRLARARESLAFSLHRNLSCRQKNKRVLLHLHAFLTQSRRRRPLLTNPEGA